jgi:hypothetical protein
MGLVVTHGTLTGSSSEQQAQDDTEIVYFCHILQHTPLPEENKFDPIRHDSVPLLVWYARTGTRRVFCNHYP